MVSGTYMLQFLIMEGELGYHSHIISFVLYVDWCIIVHLEYPVKHAHPLPCQRITVLVSEMVSQWVK